MRARPHVYLWQRIIPNKRLTGEKYQLARCKDVQVGRASGRQRGGGHRAAQKCGGAASGAHLQRPGENHRGEGERKRESGLATPASMQCTQNISMSLD